MAILKRMPKAQIEATFTHRGWFAFCPVYVAPEGDEGMVMTERNWVPSWLLWLAEGFFAVAFTLLLIVAPDYEPMWGVFITGEIEQDDD